MVSANGGRGSPSPAKVDLESASARPVLGESGFSRLGLGIRSSSALNVGESYSLLVRRGVRVKKTTGVAWCSPKRRS